MHPAVNALASSLSFGTKENDSTKSKDRDPVGSLAHVYEIARNALEYRADHLVKRAAIERILRREILFNNKPDIIAEELLQELSWARYVNEEENGSEQKTKIQSALGKYLPVFANAKIDRDWLLGVVSVEIEEIVNPNPDYQLFTNFAFHVFRRKIDLPSVKNPDLILLVALDRMFAQSDEARVAYHLYKLIKSQNPGKEENPEQILSETYSYYKAAEKSPWLPKMMTFVRKQMGPLILLRDMYFYDPANFHKGLDSEQEFKEFAGQVLAEQLTGLHKKLNTATIRSLIYVFLTKMLIVAALETPAEKLLGGTSSWVTTLFNIIIPVLIMWALSFQIKLPGKDEQQRIINQAWRQVSNFDAPLDKREMLTEEKKRSSQIFSVLFYGLYGLLFYAIFSMIFRGLTQFGFSLVSKAIFLFFLCVVTFFAYRIRQYSLVYTFKPKTGPRSSVVDMLILPIVVAGGWMSKGISRLNFLVFFFDFILESPFKIILRFLDSWFQFLSAKKEEAVG